MSLTRNREEFRPHKWEGIRLKYFTKLERKAADLPPPPPPVPEEPREPYFSVNTVRRAPKIEDEDDDYVAEINPAAASQFSLPNGRNSRANSMRSNYSGYGNIPYGARVHRASWSSRDFQNWQIRENDGAESPLRAPSRAASGTHTANTSISGAPLMHPQRSQTTLRFSNATIDSQINPGHQRIGSAK